MDTYERIEQELIKKLTFSDIVKGAQAHTQAHIHFLTCRPFYAIIFNMIFTFIKFPLFMKSNPFCKLHTSNQQQYRISICVLQELTSMCVVKKR